MDSGGSKRSLYIAKVLILFGIYFITANWGLGLNAVNKFATLIWPPTGIALAALLIFGNNLWPGIALGAFFVNLHVGATPLVALGISTGNTLEALLASALLRRVGFRHGFERLSDVLNFVFLAAFFSTLVSVTVGVTTLLLTGTIPFIAYGQTWIAWWLGDTMGDLVVAPFLLVWSLPFTFKKVSLRQFIETFALILLLFLSSYIVFSDWLSRGNSIFPRPYLMFPVLMIIALRLGQRGLVFAHLVVSTIAIGATMLGQGSFLSPSLSESFILLQTYLAVLIISKFVLVALVAERKEEQKALQQSNMENARLYHEAQEAISARDEFLSIASHELKTPLTSLSLQLQVFNRELKKSMKAEAATTVSIPSRVANMISGCETQTKKLTNLLDELLDLTRIRLGKLQLNRENIDLVSVVKETMERFKAEATQKGASISLQADVSASGFWDRIRIEQIISNLLSNAIKYGEGKDISVVVQKDEAHKIIKLSVHDKGLGIAPEMQGRIFERFERAGVTGQKIAGLGLGLYICRQIIEAHGGNIRVESKVGEGSTFMIELPISGGI